MAILYYNPDPYTEVSRTYSGGTIFTGNTSVLSEQPTELRADYIGAATNAVDPIYNIMYVALEDTAGNVGVYLNNPTAQQVTAWTQWYISLKDINSAGQPNPVKLAAVTLSTSALVGQAVVCPPVLWAPATTAT